ncbi:MAG TPA: hypothetical protein VMB50_22160 [Myxococcales bacterium]|nr:hypothetical protein [Myxococcales bacterium]
MLLLAFGGGMFGLSIVSLLATRRRRVAVSTGAISLALSLLVTGWILWNPWGFPLSASAWLLLFAAVPATMALIGIFRKRDAS